MSFDIISTIDLLGCLQGLIFGCILLYMGLSQKRSTIFLGIFVLFFGYSNIGLVLITQSTDFYLLPRIGEWLLAPLFLIYVQQTSILSQRPSYWTLIPGILWLVVQFIFVFVLSPNQKLALIEQAWYQNVFLLGTLFSLAIIIYTHLLLKRHSKEVRNQYAQTTNKELRWAETFNILAFILVLLHIAHPFIPNSFSYRLFFSLLHLFMIYWVSIKGCSQHKIPSFIAPISSDDTEENMIKTLERKDQRETQKKLVNTIETYMLDSEAYMNKELTIMDLAVALQSHPRRISQAINNVNNENFNSYINRYRIKKAKDLLACESSINLSIEGIGNEVGFQSKSTFYSAFKKFTGTTPNQYKKRLPYKT